MPQYKKGQNAVLIFGAWDPRVQVLPIRARVSIPSLGIADAPATVRQIGEVIYNLHREHTAELGEHEVIWRLTVPIIGDQTLEIDPLDESREIEVVTTFEIVDEPQAEPKPYLPTPLEVRNGTLNGIPLTDAEGYIFPDESIQLAIDAAASWMEQLLDTVFCHADGTPKVVSSDPRDAGVDVLEDPYDFDPQAMQNWGFIQLKRRPIREIEKLSLQIADQPIFDFPKEWLQLYGDTGQIHIVPAAVSSIPVGLYGSIFPSSIGAGGFFGGRLSGRLPGALKIRYKAGWSRIPDDVRRAITWKACYDVLNTVSDSTTAGLASQSISVDGVSQSLTTTNSSTNSTYGANQLFLQKMLDEFIKKVAPRYRAVSIVVM